MTVFVDTSYYIATLSARDQWSKIAAKASGSGLRVVTSAAVIDETITLLQNRGFLSAALAFLTEMRDTQDVQIIYGDPILQREAWDLFNRFAGSGANAVDCISFAIMRRMSIKKAFTFDRHFRDAGFEILR